MKIQTLTALAAASTVAASASAAITVYDSYSAWAAAANAVVTAAGSGAVYGNNWSGGYAPTGTGTVTFGGGWQNMSAVSTGPALTTGVGTIVVTQNTSSQQNVQFNFLANTWGAPHGPVAPNGFYGFGIYYSSATGSNATNSIQMGANGAGLLGQFGAMTSGFIGVVGNWGSTPSDRLDNVTFIFNANQGVTITGTAFASVPAPGAAALLGVAGLIGSRRRR